MVEICNKNSDLSGFIASFNQVEELAGLLRTSIWRLEREGKFPARVPLTSGNVGWRLTDV